MFAVHLTLDYDGFADPDYFLEGLAECMKSPEQKPVRTDSRCGVCDRDKKPLL